jgi:hypothetical protein
VDAMDAKVHVIRHAIQAVQKLVKIVAAIHVQKAVMTDAAQIAQVIVSKDAKKIAVDAIITVVDHVVIIAVHALAHAHRHAIITAQSYAKINVLVARANASMRVVLHALQIAVKIVCRIVTVNAPAQLQNLAAG